MTGNSAALDSNCAIAVLNGMPEALRWITQLDEVFIPVPVLAELRFGALNSGRPAANLAKIDEMVARSQTLDLRASTAAVYAELRRKLKALGRPIPQNDLWIAAACVEQSAPLATLDNHFDAIDSLKIVRPF